MPAVENFDSCPDMANMFRPEVPEENEDRACANECTYSCLCALPDLMNGDPASLESCVELYPHGSRLGLGDGSLSCVYRAVATLHCEDLFDKQREAGGRPISNFDVAYMHCIRGCKRQCEQSVEYLFANDPCSLTIRQSAHYLNCDNPRCPPSQ